MADIFISYAREDQQKARILLKCSRTKEVVLVGSRAEDYPISYRGLSPCSIWVHLVQTGIWCPAGVLIVLLSV
jgi:hypothetical protein